MIVFDKVSKSYQNNQILKDISFTVDDGTLVCLIGESGCGKTTTLKMINKLISITSGNIFINGKNVKDIDEIELRRSMGYVIQSTGLFPHMTIRENIELISKLEKINLNKIKKKTLEMIKMVGLDEALLDRYPTELSGGQQQRIGIARAFMTDPKIILMDEPFSALDPISRNSLQDALIKIQDHYHKTIVFVTHDMDEAIKIADKIAIMNDGELVQYDTPEIILKEPKDSFVENFVGKKRIWANPKMIKVKDIMITNPVMCRDDYSMFYCLNKMKTTKVGTCFIVDNDNRLQGVLYAEHFKNIKVTKKKARDFMVNDFVAVNKEQSIVDVAEIVKEYKLPIIAVIDNDGALCGLITKSSLVISLSNQFVEGDGE